MTDMESLDRAVEEARAKLDAWVKDVHPRRHGSYGYDLTAFEAAVSAKARAEERERAVDLGNAITNWMRLRERLWSSDWTYDRHLDDAERKVIAAFERARSSEEAGG